MNSLSSQKMLRTFVLSLVKFLDVFTEKKGLVQRERAIKVAFLIIYIYKLSAKNILKKKERDVGNNIRFQKKMKGGWENFCMNIKFEKKKREIGTKFCTSSFLGKKIQVTIAKYIYKFWTISSWEKKYIKAMLHKKREKLAKLKYILTKKDFEPIYSAIFFLERR